MLEFEINYYKELKSQIAEKNAILKKLKKDIIEAMDSYGVKNLRNEFGSAAVSFPKSFDEYGCKSSHKQECAQFITKKTITEEIEEFDKKGFKNKYPELFDKFQIELTARLTIK